jgi:septal ring factor EnvC (AmiA/AmiB activator)
MMFKLYTKYPATLLMTSLIVVSNSSHSQTVLETKRSLEQLNHKIAVIQQDLQHSHHQQTQFQQQLHLTELQIRSNETTLRNIQQKIPLKQAEIAQIETQIGQTKQQFAQLQGLLMQQIQARYQQTPNQPLAWFLIHPEKAKIDQILTYYHYILHTHEHTLQQLKLTQHTLQTQQNTLKQEITNLHAMQHQAQIEQHQLQIHKNRHQALLNSVQQHLVSQENTLSEYQRNRDNLSQILNKLGRESVIQTRHSMSSMRRKLPNPVAVEKSRIHKIHQGVMLDSPEGSAVHAVYPGKIVFGEWLNGYGLLVIVDHGWGLMTLYANNQSLTKHVGEIVSQGEQIATVGHGGITKDAGLYFEVRKHGKAISPLDWLGRA